MIAHTLTVEDILAARRQDLNRILAAGKAVRPGSAWIYQACDQRPGVRAMLLRTSKLDRLLQAAREDGVLAAGLAALSWTPVVTRVQRFVWIWVEMRGLGGSIYMAQIADSSLGEWRYQIELPPIAIPLSASGSPADPLVPTCQETDSCPPIPRMS